MKTKKQPAKYERCVKSVSKRGGANAYAVCAPLRKNVGQDKYARDYFRALDAHDRAEEKLKHLTGSKLWSTEPQGSPAQIQRAKQAKAKTLKALQKAESKMADARSRGVYRGGIYRNPAEAAAEGYREFHGEDPKEFIKIEQRVHFHKHLSGAGQLEYLKVDGVDGYKHTLKGFDGALLAFNEKKSQLFIEGGDQSIDLASFGITEPHELETLGKVTRVGYFTTKKHLGEDGGTAIFDHKFRTTNEDGRHVTVRIKRYPDLIYRVLDEHMEFSGGSYEIRREGIDY